MLIDIHCHLDALEETGISMDRVLKNAIKRGLGVILTNSTSLKNMENTLAISKKYESIKAALGLYPIDAISMSRDDIEKAFEVIRENKDQIESIGEIGMDFKEDSDHHDIQSKIFKRLVKLSIGLDLPVTVHSRKAEIDCIKVLERANARKVIMHFFSGKLKLVKRILDNGWHLSIPTSVKSSEHFQKVVAMSPIQKLFCETDSPFSHPDKGFPNEPANVIESYKMVSKIKGAGLEEVKQTISWNYRRLFAKR